MTNNYKDYLKNLKNSRVLVIGDIMVDRFLYGDVTRISPEAPVPILHANHEESYIGGAGNVFRNIISILGDNTLGSVDIIGVVGDDKSGNIIINEIAKHGITDSSIIVSENYRTITKTRIVAGVQQIVRIDEEDLTPFSSKVGTAIIKNFEKKIEEYDTVIISDYGKGVITANIAKYIIKTCRSKSKYVLVDPIVKHFLFYKNANLITPNFKEATEGIGFNILNHEFDVNRINILGNKIKNKLSLSNLMITLGAHGMALFSDDIKKDEAYIIPTKAKAVFDVSGAGDTVIALTAMCISLGLSFKDSAYIANVGAGIVVSKMGTSTLTLRELQNAL